MARIETTTEIEVADEAAASQPLPRRWLSFAIPDRRVLAAMLAFVILCLVLVAGSPQSRVGDAGEYEAMAYQFARVRPPALSAADIVDLDRHYAGLVGRMDGYQGSVPQYEALKSGGRYDMIHFWIYPLAAAPFVKVMHLLNLPDTYGFAAFNIGLAAFAFGVVARRRGLLVAALLFVSPLLWWIDKPHAEVFMCSLLLLALLWARDRPQLGLIAMALVVANNVSLGPALAVYGCWLLLVHRRALFATAWQKVGVSAAVAIAALHPLYYLVRLGSIDPVALIEDNSLRVPTVTRLITPLVDPYVGLLVWWPVLFVAAAAAGLRKAWTRPITARTPAEWAMVWAPFAVVLMVLIGQAQNRQPASGGSFAMARYAMWIAPFAVFAFHRHVLRGRWQIGAAGALVTVSAVLSVQVARPSLPDVWFTTEPTFVAAAVVDHAPWLWNPTPQIFLSREWRQYGKLEPVANESCTKLLAISGVWPTTCPEPVDVPRDCLVSYFCYANRSGTDYTFVAVEEYG
ncbi:MAG: hypothetical protein ABMA25_22505 [Ilumatobacteraceae bacterium]